MCINCLNTGYDLCAECDVRTVHVRDDVARAGRTHYINEHHQYHVFAKLYCPLPLGTPEESILLRNRLVRPPFYTPQLMLTYRCSTRMPHTLECVCVVRTDAGNVLQCHEPPISW